MREKIIKTPVSRPKLYLNPFIRHYSTNLNRLLDHVTTYIRDMAI